MDNRYSLPAVVISAAFLASIGLLASTAQAAQVGNDAIDRASYDTWNNFTLGLTSEVFGAAGTVTNWEVFANSIGTVGMLLLRNTGGTNYQVVGADINTVSSTGLNSFTFSADSGTNAVQAGDILGLYIAGAKVDFDFLTSGDSVSWCGSNGCQGAAPVAGNTLSLTGSGNRVYSANVTVSEVPLPAAAWLFGSALLGFVGISRRKSAQA